MIYGIYIWRLWKIPCEDDCDDKNEVEGLSGCQKVGPVPLPETLSAKYAFLASQDALEVMGVTYLLTESALALTLLM